MSIFKWLGSIASDTFANNGLSVIVTVLGVLALGGGYLHFTHKLEKVELARQCEVYREAAQDKITQLNRSNSNVTETIESIDPDNLNDWVERINGMQRKAD